LSSAFMEAPMTFAEQQDTSKSAGELSEAMREMAAAVSDEELFESLCVEPDKKDKIQKQLEKGEYLFAPERIKVKEGAADKVFELLIDAFKEHLSEKTEDWEKLGQAYRSGQIPADKLLEATLRHRWDALQGWAQKFSLDIDALQFFSLYLARPFRQQAAELLLDRTQLSAWQKGFCPVCGHNPVLGRMIGAPGRRRLWCCCCNTSWVFARIGCPFCGNQSQDQLGYLTVEEFASYRIYVCDNCKRYLKTVVHPEESDKDDWDYEREYFSAVALDPIAIREGYIAEPVWLARCEQPA